MIIRASRAALSNWAMFVVLQRDGHAGDAEKSPFYGGRHRAGVQHVYARVQSAVDSAYDQIGLARAKLMDADFHAVGRTAFDRPAQPLVAVWAILMKDLLDDQGRQIGDRMAHAALLGCRGYYHHFAQMAHFPGHGRQARCVNAVVVG